MQECVAYKKKCVVHELALLQVQSLAESSQRRKNSTFEYDKEPISSLTLFLPIFPFDPPEKIRKPLVF